MHLDDDLCYRALESRDARFDGRFFTGVSSTGIYCRPVCPAKTPRRRNCRFFRSAAEAEGEGFRPCLRCRPECSPRAPVWAGPAATVSRGVRLIHEGALGRTGVDGLARRLGVGARHLRRLFHDHLGASPIALEQTRRVQFAKQLLDETQLPIGVVAQSAGFKSARRFNTAFREVYGCSPRELRSRRERPLSSELKLRLAYRPPLHWQALIGFLERRVVAGVESVEGSVYCRTVDVDGSIGTIRVSPVADESALVLAVSDSLVLGLPSIVERVRSLFDLDADPQRIEGPLRRDPLLRASIRRRPGLRIPGCWDGFELAVRAVLGQQVSVPGAVTLASRLVERYGERVAERRAGLSRLFPTAERLARGRLASIGMPGSRAAAISSLARTVASGELDLDTATDVEATVARLCRIRGIGPWTAEYIAMRALREPDAFPASDLGVMKALAVESQREASRRAEGWRPWRAYGVMHLWQGSA